MSRIASPHRVSLILALSAAFAAAEQGPPRQWEIHDPKRPLPPVVDPRGPGAAEVPGRPPSDAIVLFDGQDLSRWRSEKAGPACWEVERGYAAVVKRAGGRV